MGREFKAKLSSGVLGMKFMQRSKRKYEEKQEIQESQDMYSSELTKEMKEGESKLITQNSILFCEDLIDGRVSYEGFNVEIENLMAQRLCKEETTRETEVDDEEMATRYDSLIRKKKFKRS